MFENTRIASKDVDINDLAEKSWQEIQSAFGSDTSLDGKISIPAKFVSTGLGLNLDRTKTNNLARKANRQNLYKSAQTYDLF